MPDPGSRTTRQTLLLLTSLYLAQGLPFGFFTQTVPVLLRQQQVSLRWIGLSSLLALPWALKFLWAPWVERRAGPGRRKRWIVPLIVGAGLLLGALAPFDPARILWPLLVAALLANLLAATQDIATDGLAIDLLEPEARGLGNGVQVAGYRAGMVLGGGALLIVIERAGWGVACLAAAAAMLLAALPLHLLREPPAKPAAGAPPSLRGAWRPGLGPWLALLAIYKLGDALGTAMLRPFLVDAGLSLGTLGWLLGGVGFVAGLLGALLGGAAIKPLGRRAALVGFALLQAAAMGGYLLAALAPRSLPALTALVGFEHLVGGMATAALFTVMMDACRAEAAATDYTLQACVVVLATGAASALSGYLAEAVGYAGHFGVALAVCLAGSLAAARAKLLAGGAES